MSEDINNPVVEKEVSMQNSTEVKPEDTNATVPPSVTEVKDEVVKESKATAKSFLDTVKEMSNCVIKQAPVALKTSLSIAGKGADALSKALHKMSEMVPVEKVSKETSSTTEKPVQKDG